MKIDVLDKGYVRHIDTLGTDLSVVNAARASYDKESKAFSEGDAKLLNFLLREGHLSPLRHAALTFEVFAPLMVARQWWKYAVGSTFADDQNGWNESSRRYVTENEVFYVPEYIQWRSKPENSKQGSGPIVDPETGEFYTAKLVDIYNRGLDLYQSALDDGIAPEQARLFLPAYGMYVRYRWTTSLAAVLHFLEQRLAHDSQAEIQEYARAVEKIVMREFPKVYEAYKLEKR